MDCQYCQPTTGFYLGTTCHHCNTPFRNMKTLKQLKCEFSSLQRGERHTIELLGLMTVKYHICWENDNYGSLMVDSIKANEALKKFIGNDADLKELIADRVQNGMCENEFNNDFDCFNERIQSFIKDTEEFGKSKYNNEDWFFEKYVW